MSSVTSLPPNTGASPRYALPSRPVRQFSVAEYQRMIETGTIREDERVELLDGWILEKMPRSPAHDMTVDLIPDVLRPLLPSGWRIRIQLAVAFSESQPEPDIAIVLEPVTRYAKSHPGPSDVGQLIEVSESSLSYDRHEKAEIYAQAGIATYWIVNLPDRQIEVHSDPTGPARSPQYRSKQILRSGDLVPIMIAGQQAGALAVDDLLPPP